MVFIVGAAFGFLLAVAVVSHHQAHVIEWQRKRTLELRGENDQLKKDIESLKEELERLRKFIYGNDDLYSAYREMSLVVPDKPPADPKAIPTPRRRGGPGKGGAL